MLGFNQMESHLNRCPHLTQMMRCKTLNVTDTFRRIAMMDEKRREKCELLYTDIVLLRHGLVW